MTDESVIEKTVSKRLSRLNKKKPAESVPDDSRTRAEKEIDAAIKKSGVKEKRDAQRKKFMKRGAILGVIALLGYGIYLLFVPYKGGAAFGLCKVFLESQVRYPTTLKLSGVEFIGESMRIWFSDIDAFGDYKLRPIQCYFKNDENLGLILDRITIDRREIDPLKVTAFNRIIPVVLQNMPDLTYPAPLPDSLADLQIDATRFMKPILDRMPTSGP
jgi:hypothetical protein